MRTTVIAFLSWSFGVVCGVVGIFGLAHTAASMAEKVAEDIAEKAAEDRGF